MNDDAALRRAGRRIYREAGIVTGPSKHAGVLRRLARRWGVDGDAAVRRLGTLSDDDPAWTDVVESGTVNETSFFRTASHFDWIRRWLESDAGDATSTRAGSSHGNANNDSQ